MDSDGGESTQMNKGQWDCEYEYFGSADKSFKLKGESSI